MNKAFERIMQEFEQNPLQTIAVGSMAAMAVSKLVNSFSAARRDRVWAREVARRERLTYRR